MKLKKGEIENIINFLDGITLKGRGSLGRTKLKEELQAINEERLKDQVAIIDEFQGWTEKEEGKYKTDDVELNKAINDLLLDEVEITFNTPFRQDLVNALEDYEGELDGQKADAYAVLYEKLVVGNENKKENENE